MKTLIRIFFFITIAGIYFSCDDDDNSVKGEPLSLTASADTLVLVESQGNSEALSFTWNKGIEREPGYEVSYIFRLDVAENNFDTSTEPDTIDTFGKSFSHVELNEIISEKWGVEPGMSVDLEARVVGKVTGPKFMYPEIAYSKIHVTTYIQEPKPLYIIGSATAAGDDLSKGIKINEFTIGKRYHWQGELKAGKFMFVTSTTSAVPALCKGEDDTTLIESESLTDSNNQFTIETTGTYGIAIDRSTMKIVYRKVPYSQVFLIGNATTAEWNLDNAIEMEYSVWNPGIQTVVVELGEGELKLLTRRDWSADTYRPMIADGSIQDTQTQVYKGGADLKWKIEPEEKGKYKITLNMDNNTILFEKQ